MHRQRAFALVLVLLVGIGLFLITRQATDAPAVGDSAIAGDTSGSSASPATAPPASPRAVEPAATPPARTVSPPVSAARPARAAEPASAPRASAEAPPTAATLTIEADVPEAQVFIDRHFAGTTPLTRFGLEPGRHQINVTAPGYEQQVQSLDLEPGPHDLLVRFREVRLDARIPVVHRHGIGSCRGALVATADGLRYETDHDDAFTAPLTALNELQVDYLAGRLKVVAQGGRQYDFSHPDGDADRLLVFQRDVNRARERLLAGHPPSR